MALSSLIPSWAALRRIGNSRIVKLTILIPVVGYMVIFNQYVAEYLSFSPVLGLDGGAAVALDRLRFIYVGLCFLAMGSVFFILFCPKKIAYHDSEQSYCRSELEVMTPPRFAQIKREIVLQESNLQGPYRARFEYLTGHDLTEGVGFPMETRSANWQDWSNKNRGLLTTALSLHYDLANRESALARALAALSYAVGWLALLWPSMLTFIAVARPIFM